MARATRLGRTGLAVHSEVGTDAIARVSGLEKRTEPRAEVPDAPALGVHNEGSMPWRRLRSQDE